MKSCIVQDKNILLFSAQFKEATSASDLYDRLTSGKTARYFDKSMLMHLARPQLADLQHEPRQRRAAYGNPSARYALKGLSVPNNLWE